MSCDASDGGSIEQVSTVLEPTNETLWAILEGE
jgi:hypothetical protein